MTSMSSTEVVVTLRFLAEVETLEHADDCRLVVCLVVIAIDAVVGSVVVSSK